MLALMPVTTGGAMLQAHIILSKMVLALAMRLGLI
jgi:hypothetical protein